MRLYGTNRLVDRAQAKELLACAAAQTWGCTQLPELARHSGGKPWFPAYPDWHFNLSHSANLALCAVDDAPVGVDIQIVKATWKEGLPGRVSSREELAWLNEQENPWNAFALLWAMKESRVKQDGRGLTVSIRSIRVPLPKKAGELCLLDGLWFRTYAGSGWAACACGINRPPEDIFWLNT